MTLNGYNRLRCFNDHIPMDIQIHFIKNIGRNERVVISDFLIGKRGENMPSLPYDINTKIKNTDIHSIKRFSEKMKKILIEIENEHDVNKRIAIVIYLFRYLNIHNDFRSYNLSNIIINKSYDIMDEIEYLYEDKKYFISDSPYLTRKKAKDIKNLDFFRKLYYDAKREIIPVLNKAIIFCNSYNHN